MRGIGKTVFSGDRIEDFQVEILGVLENIGPKQSLILARLSGGPIETTGVMQGMSGSPVYIDGKLVGAVAMAFPFSKEPIAGIRPIADMLGVPNKPAARAKIRLTDTDVLASLPKRGETQFGSKRSSGLLPNCARWDSSRCRESPAEAAFPTPWARARRCSPGR